MRGLGSSRKAGENTATLAVGEEAGNGAGRLV
jgi:hypothetical protein